MSKTDRSEIAKKVAKHRNDITFELKDTLKEWNREAQEKAKGKEVCVVCGDCIPETIMQKHHFNPQYKPEGKYSLCGSCHNIFNKIGIKTTKAKVESDLELRHERFNQNLKNLTHDK
jgi:uncharacterized CHY-type Zn-finger protein